MKVYQIEVDDTLNHILEEAARIMDVNIESFITEILNRYALDPHIMEKEDVKDGYEKMGDINLEISNR
ncbi:MAG: hypothetical protein HFE47_05390 [Clostridia bacterium]|nr:hypothetical protein [Clostridia bacterium]